MTLKQFLDANPLLMSVLAEDPVRFANLYNEAYRHVRMRLSLYPKLFKLTFTGACNLNPPLLVSTGGQVQFKEITEIIGQSLMETKPDKSLSDGVVSFGELTGYDSDVDVYFSHNYIYADSDSEISIPCVGHLYPPCAYIISSNTPLVTMTTSVLGMQSNIGIPDILVLPFTAKMYANLALDSMDIGSHNGYDALCNAYLNIRNSGARNITTRGMTNITTVEPYALL